MTNLKCEYNEEIGHYGQTLFIELDISFKIFPFLPFEMTFSDFNQIPMHKAGLTRFMQWKIYSVSKQLQIRNFDDLFDFTIAVLC